MPAIPIERHLSKFVKQPTDVPKILEAMATRLGEKNPEGWKWLGEGSYAQVYWLHDKKKALKITRDKDDANASLILKNKPDKSIVKVYDVFDIPIRSGFYNGMFGIVVEKLSPLSREEGDRIMNLLYLLMDLSISEIPTMKNVNEFKERLLNPDLEKHPIDKHLQTYYDRSGVTEKDIDLWETWAKALDARHIRWKDFKVLNVMARGREVVISDLGFSDVPSQSIPKLQVSEL